VTSDSAPTGQPRILVVDDEPTLLRAMERMLRRHASVAVADSAEKALEMLGESPAFDVVFCDVMMPGMTGIEFHWEVRRRHGAFADRIVFLTGGTFGGNSLGGIANVCLEKPVSFAEIEAQIRRFVPLVS